MCLYYDKYNTNYIIVIANIGKIRRCETFFFRIVTKMFSSCYIKVGSPKTIYGKYNKTSVIVVKIFFSKS